MTVSPTWFGRSARIDDDAGTPVGINLAVGAVTITTAVFVAASLPIADSQWRCAVVATALGLFAAFTADGTAVAAIILPTWMVMNGFLVNRLGDLSWHGSADLDRLLALVVAGCIGLAVIDTRRHVQHLRETWRLGVVVQEMRTEFNEEKKHRA